MGKSGSMALTTPLSSSRFFPRNILRARHQRKIPVAHFVCAGTPDSRGSLRVDPLAGTVDPFDAIEELRCFQTFG
jgi:hypothetical protein